MEFYNKVVGGGGRYDTGGFFSFFFFFSVLYCSLGLMNYFTVSILVWYCVVRKLMEVIGRLGG